ncbi:MAG TPA: hypothetical protein VJZ26_19530 [Blastocatellia bacterium]|nr:hypothetical protein [Blastocatellia bacterium]
MPRDVPTTTAESSRARYELELYLLGGRFDLYEDERHVAGVEPDSSAAEVSFGKLIFSCWGDGWSRSWRVVKCELMAERLRLDCAKQMGRVRCVVELRRGPAVSDADESSGEFARKLSALVESNLAGLRVERAIAARNDQRHISGIHARLTINDRGRVVAGIGTSCARTQANIDATLGAGIIWLDALRRRNRPVNRLMIFAPRGRATTIATRLTAVEIKGARVSLYETDEQAGAIRPVTPFDQGDLSDRLRRAAMRAEWPLPLHLPASVEALVDSVSDLAPGLVESDCRGGWVLLSIQGLEFARISVGGKRVEFGIGRAKERLTRTNQPQLETLVAEIAKNRTAEGSDRNSPLFRGQAERWLETILRRDIRALDSTLDPRYVYSQVPAYRGEQRSFIDLLAATREGRLVVIELKVTEDPEFPFQGLDYWLRIEWHRLRGDFQSRGYFKELELTDEPPMLYLIAPLFRFHATTNLVASSVAGRVPVYRLGINEDWRAGVRVLLRERMNQAG